MGFIASSWRMLGATLGGACGVSLLATFCSPWYVCLLLPYSVFLVYLYLFMAIGNEGIRKLKRGLREN